MKRDNIKFMAAFIMIIALCSIAYANTYGYRTFAEIYNIKGEVDKRIDGCYNTNSSLNDFDNTGNLFDGFYTKYRVKGWDYKHYDYNQICELIEPSYVNIDDQSIYLYKTISERQSIDDFLPYCCEMISLEGPTQVSPPFQVAFDSNYTLIDNPYKVVVTQYYSKKLRTFTASAFDLIRCVPDATAVGSTCQPICLDSDGDGFKIINPALPYDPEVFGDFCGIPDCDDSNPLVYPGAPEYCDRVDNQCPGDPGYGEIDEGCEIPVILSAGPSGNVQSGIITLTAVTDINAYCRYSTLPNQEFVSMSLFDNTYSTQHSTPVTINAPGGYNYYVKCKKA